MLGIFAYYDLHRPSSSGSGLASKRGVAVGSSASGVSSGLEASLFTATSWAGDRWLVCWCAIEVATRRSVLHWLLAVESAGASGHVELSRIRSHFCPSFLTQLSTEHREREREREREIYIYIHIYIH